jgi:hypothetical protein
MQSKNQQKMIQRHVWHDYLDVAEDLRHSHEIKEIYGKRKETIERVFAAINLKKLASWTRRAPAVKAEMMTLS